MSNIVETLIEAYEAKLEPYTDASGFNKPAAFRAALRSVKPEDISDAMVDAFASEAKSPAFSYEATRRAIAAAIAAGA